MSAEKVFISSFLVFLLFLFSIGFSSYGSWTNEFNITGQLGAPNNFPHRFTINGSASCAFNDARDLFCSNQAQTNNLSIYRLNNTWNYSSSGINTTVFARSNETWFRCYCNNPTDSNQVGHDDPINAFSLYEGVWVMTTNMTNETGTVLDLKYQNNATRQSSSGGVNLIVTNGMLCTNITGIATNINTTTMYRSSSTANFTWSAWYQAWNGAATGQRRFFGSLDTSNWFADLGTPGTANGCPNDNYYNPHITLVFFDGSNNCLDTGDFKYGDFFHLSLHTFSNNVTIAMNGSINQTMKPTGNLDIGTTNNVVGQTNGNLGLSGSVCELVRISGNGNQWLAPFEANRTYYIQSTSAPSGSGTITSCQNITSQGSYSLSNSISGITDSICLNISTSNVILNGNGNSLTGIQSTGTNVGVFVGTSPSFPNSNYLTNITITNLNVYNFSYGIYLASSKNVSIFDSKIQNNSKGVSSFSFPAIINNNTFRNLTFTNNTLALDLYSDSNDTLSLSNFTNNSLAIQFQLANTNNTFTNNTFTNNTIDLKTTTSGNIVNTFSNNTFAYSQTPLSLSNGFSNSLFNYNYFVNGSFTIDSISDVNLTNNTFRQNQLYLNLPRSTFVFSNNTFINNTFASGILTERGSTFANNSFINNTFTNIVDLSGGFGDTFISNIFKNSFEGVFLVTDSDETFINNNFTNNNYGAYLIGASNVNFTNNTFSNNQIGLLVLQSSDIDLNNNYFTSNTQYGISYCDSTFNNFYSSIFSGNNMDLGGCSAPSGSSFVYLPPQPIVQPTPEIPNPIVPIYTKEKNYTNIINRTYKFDVIPKIIYDPIYNLSNGSILYSRKIDLVNIENQTLNLAYRYECSSYNPQCLNENYCTITFYESDLIAKNYTTIKPGTAIPFRLNCAIPKTYLGRNIEGTIILSPQGFNPDYNEKRISVTLYPDIQSPISQYGSQISESVSPFISNLGTNFSLFLESFINLVKYYSSKLVGG